MPRGGWPRVQTYGRSRGSVLTRGSFARGARTRKVELLLVRRAAFRCGFHGTPQIERQARHCYLRNESSGGFALLDGGMHRESRRGYRATGRFLERWRDAGDENGSSRRVVRGAL